MQQFYTVDSVTGAGKTTAALDCAAQTPAINYTIVMPTRRLIGRAIKEFKKRHSIAGKRIKAIHSSRTQRGPVTGRIAEFLKTVTVDQGTILFITHEAFLRMRNWHRPDHWHLIIDEVVEATYNETFPLYENRQKLIDLVHLHRFDDTYSFIDASQTDGIRKVAVNRKRDKITAIFQDLAAKLDNRSPWQLFVDTAHYQRFCDGELSELEIHGLLHPSKFDGFASVTLMAANLRDSLMYRYFASLGCEFRDHRRILSRLRYRDHCNGSRLLILYLTNRRWSKTFRDTAIEYEGEEIALGDLLILQIRGKFADQPYLWMANKDEADDALEGKKLPNVPHGLDDFQGYHRCAVLSALLPTKAHGKFLANVANIAEREVRKALLSQVAYQALGRGSLRNPGATEQFILIVPDRDTAEDVAELYPGCEIQMLMDYDPAPAEKKRGRPATYESEEDRQKARREQTRDRVRKYRVTQNYLSTHISGYAADNADLDPTILLHRANAMAKKDLDLLAEAAPEYTGTAGFARSDWRNKRDATGELGEAKFLTTDQFKEWLLECQTWRYAKKRSVPLFSPSLFSPDLCPGHGRTKVNAYAARGLVFDVEHSDISPDDFPTIFPDIEMLIYSSFNHTPQEPRFRICIPTTHHMPPYVSQAICEMFVARLDKLGYGDRASNKGHGLDTGKFVYSSIFYRPSKTEHAFFTHHKEGRHAVDPYQWIASCSFEIWQKIEVIREVSEPSISVYHPVCPSGGLAEYAVNRWRDVGWIEGRGRKEFWFFAKGLHKAGWGKDDIRTKLIEEHDVAHNPTERLGEIESILNGLP